MKVRGALLKAISDEMAKSNAGVDKVVQIYFSGVLMRTMHCDLEERATDQVLSVTIDRDGNDADSRSAWDEVLRKIKSVGLAHKISLAVGVTGRTPTHVGDIVVAVNTPATIITVIGLSVIGFWGLLYWAIKRTNMLRDGGTGTAYSLGKTQMAYWGLIVFFCFAGVWATSGRMESIPAQVLMLLGISSSTGLAALVVSGNKQSEASQALRKALAEQRTLQAITDLTPEQALRLEQLPGEIAMHTSNSRPSPTTGSFWKDLCMDANGMSFHRMQIILWTLILGGIFAHSVILTLTMPEFSETLLTLLGISNGTYIGFKIPEKQ